MARVKDWMIDMEELTGQALSKGLTLEEAIVYVRANIRYVDENYIRRIYKSG